MGVRPLPHVTRKGLVPAAVRTKVKRSPLLPRTHPGARLPMETQDHPENRRHLVTVMAIAAIPETAIVKGFPQTTRRTSARRLERHLPTPRATTNRTVPQQARILLRVAEKAIPTLSRQATPPHAARVVTLEAARQMARRTTPAKALPSRTRPQSVRQCLA